MEPRTDQDFIDEAVLLDGFSEFHPGFFDEMSTGRLDALVLYYGLTINPENILEWRDVHVQSDPSLQSRALKVFGDLLDEFGISANSSRRVS